MFLIDGNEARAAVEAHLVEKIMRNLPDEERELGTWLSERRREVEVIDLATERKARTDNET
jgi:hypothetical protein